MTLDKTWRGRDAFRRASPVLHTGAGLLRRTPLGLRIRVLSAVRDIEGYLGLAFRYMVFASLAQSCGENVAIYTGVHLHNPESMVVGSNVKFGEMTFVGALGGVVIGDDSSIAHGCSLITEERDLDRPGPIRDLPVSGRPIVIGAGSLLGAGCKVLAGSVIGAGCMVGAGSVVTGTLPEASVCTGVPARVLRRRADS
jgi:acetyltransferase-like isoleucine patch superfamily enzyme